MKYITAIFIFSFVFYAHTMISSDNERVFVCDDGMFEWCEQFFSDDEGIFVRDDETSIAFSELCEQHARKVMAFEESNLLRVQRAEPILRNLQTIICKMNENTEYIKKTELSSLEEEKKRIDSARKGIDKKKEYTHNTIAYTNNVLKTFVFQCFAYEAQQFQSVLQAYANIYDPLLNEQYTSGRHVLIDKYLVELNAYFYMKPDKKEKIMLELGTQGDKEEYVLNKTRMALQRFAVLRKAKHNRDIESQYNSLLDVVRNGKSELCNYGSSYTLTFNEGDVYYEEKCGFNMPRTSHNNLHDYLFAGAQQVFSDIPQQQALSYQQ